MRGRMPTPFVFVGLHPKGFFAFLTICLLLSINGTAAVFAHGTEAELNPNAEPFYGTVLLDAGFELDPYVQTMQAGGEVDVNGLTLNDVTCSGFVRAEPDFRLDWVQAPSSLRILFAAAGDSDTTLIVRQPNGQFMCNDDFDGVNPAVEVDTMMAGPYAIWVGTRTPNAYSYGYLIFTEGEFLPSDILASLGGAITSGDQTAGFGGSTETGVDTTDDGDMAEFCGGESSCMGSAEHGDIPVIPEDELIEGVVYYPGLSNLHVTTDVEYPQTPPVGGEHNPIWQTCAIYTEPIKNEHAVHSMEHGTVWITYQPDLTLDQVQLLQEITRQGEFRMLSPYPALPSPIVVTAWAYQLQLERADDPRLLEFLAVYEIGPTTPEPGAPCSGGESRTLRRLEEAATDSE